LDDADIWQIMPIIEALEAIFATTCPARQP
jgi:hypothetical protein